jgi:signal peptidase I
MFTIICSSVIISVVGLFLLTWKYLFEVVVVSGDSMLPTLMNSQLLVIKKFKLKFSIGSIYIYKSPDGSEVVKRLVRIRKRTWGSKNPLILHFEGDNKHYSKDSRHYGFVTEKDVIGKVIYWRK